jgi:hypothetical protein
MAFKWTALALDWTTLSSGNASVTVTALPPTIEGRAKLSYQINVMELSSSLELDVEVRDLSYEQVSFEAIESMDRNPRAVSHALKYASASPDRRRSTVTQMQI